MSWEAQNYSKFWGKAVEYGFKHKLGTLLPLHKQRPMSQSDAKIDSKIILQTYDFRDDFEVKDYLNPIRDQGDCAASWAFSTIGKRFKCYHLK